MILSFAHFFGLNFNQLMLFFSFSLLLYKQSLSALALELFQAEENILLLRHRGSLTFDLEYINVFVPLANAYIYCLLNLHCLNTTSISLSHTAEVPPCTNILFIFHLFIKTRPNYWHKEKFPDFMRHLKKLSNYIMTANYLLFFFV